MKTCSIMLVFLSVSFITSCSKPTEEERSYQFEVLEYKTNLPIAGAKVELFTCTRFDAVFGCRSKGLLASKVTDVKGLCSFTATDYQKANEGTTISKQGYWPSSGWSGRNYLTPEATLGMRILKKNVYPDSSFISVQINSESGSTSFLSFKAPSDSMVIMKAFGNDVNNAKWSVYTKSQGCFFCLADTLAKGSFSKPLSKMETGNTTLEF